MTSTTATSHRDDHVATTDREVTMSYADNTHAVRCPELVCAGCGGETVAARYLETTVVVAPCRPLIAQGWEGPAVVLWASQALELLEPVFVPAPVQHLEGLVVFA